MPATVPPHILELTQERDRLAAELAEQRRELADLEQRYHRTEARIAEAWRIERELLLRRLRAQRLISGDEMILLARDG